MATVLPAASVPASAGEDDRAPLQVTIDSLSPSTIPQKGRITVSGQITNNSDATWTDLNVYLLTSPEPFTRTDELEAASETDPTLEVGGRLLAPGLYSEVGDLAPGSSTNYILSVPRSALEISGASGAYWLGVHVLGANEGLRDSVADGRARTFIPLMERRGPSTSLSLVVPIKAPVRRHVDGALKGLPGWQELLGPEGRLSRLVELSGTSDQVSLTWVVDPAVLDAAQSVAEDNPPMDSGPTDEAAEDEATPAPGESPSPSSPLTDEPDTEEPPLVSAQAEEAATWLDLFRRQADQHAVLAVPYGDVDVAALTRADFADTVERASALSASTLENLGIDAGPVIAPPTGYLPNPALSQLDDEVPLLLSDAAAPATDDTVIETTQGNEIVLADTSAGDGGPGPAPRFRAIAMRQRLLSEAAVHALSDQGDQPLVVTTPQFWDPGSDWRSADFFSGLNVPWLRTVSLPTAQVIGSAGDDKRRYDARLAYPPREQRAELPIANLLATEELVRTGNVYANLLARNDTVDEYLAKSAMLGSSYRVRGRAHAAATRTREITKTIRARMEQISIDGPSFVTMSSEEGTFQVTVVNGLQEPVTVGIDARTSSPDLEIFPPDPVSLGPGQRASVRLRATAEDIGVHSVTLVPTNSDGQPLGNTTKFAVRSSQVGLVIWVIMGVGAAVLFGTAGMRIFSRVRERKATPGPLLEESSR